MKPQKNIACKHYKNVGKNVEYSVQGKAPINGPFYTICIKGQMHLLNIVKFLVEPCLEEGSKALATRIVDGSLMHRIECSELYKFLPSLNMLTWIGYQFGQNS